MTITGQTPNGSKFTISNERGCNRLDWHPFGLIGSIGIPLKPDADLGEIERQLLALGSVTPETHARYFATSGKQNMNKKTHMESIAREQDEVKSNTLTLAASEIGPFFTPPECAGQIVARSYAVFHAPFEDGILERIYDASDRSEKLTAYQFPTRGEFEPWNGAPKLGRRMRKVQMGGAK